MARAGGAAPGPGSPSRGAQSPGPPRARARSARTSRGTCGATARKPRVMLACQPSPLAECRGPLRERSDPEGRDQLVLGLDWHTVDVGLIEPVPRIRKA